MRISLEDVFALSGIALLIGSVWYDYGYTKAGMVLGVLLLCAAVLRVK